MSGSRALPVRLAVLIGLAVAVLLPAGVWLERVLADRLVRSRIADLERSLDSAVASTEAKIALTDVRVSRLGLILGTAATPTGRLAATDFARATRRAPDGTYRLARSINPLVEASLWIPARHPLTDYWKGLLIRGTAIVGQVGTGSVGETADDVWFMTLGGAEIMYIPSDPQYADRPNPPTYDPSSWIDPIRAENAAEGRPVWLPPQRSPRPPIWFVTVESPVYNGGNLVGVAGLDFSVDGLFNQIARAGGGSSNGRLIVDRDGLIIHGIGADFERANADSMSIADLPKPLGDSLRALLARVGGAPPGEVATGEIGSRVMMAVRLARPAWIVVTLTERAEIVAPLQAPLRVMRVALVSVLLLLLIAVLAAVGSDIRRQRIFDQAKVRAGERFNRLFEILPVAVVLLQSDTNRLVEANDAVTRLTGLPRDRLLGMTTAAIGLWRSADELAQVRQRIQLDGFLRDYATHLELANGKQIEVLVAARPVGVDDQPHLLAVIQDLSAQRQLEAQLVQSQRLEAVGRLAGGIAHDFNNLLTAVIGYSELLTVSFPADDERRSDVQEILRAARRGATLIRQLLGFARQQTTAPRPTDVNELIGGLAGLLKPLIGEGVTIVTDLEPQVGSVMIDPGQFEQVITNLAVNARDAMVGGGIIFIRTRDDGTNVHVEVTDTGPGIPAEIRAHIFEPFFTTKEPGKGTGLGLATCYGIVRQAGGSIECDCPPDRGTTFVVSFPRCGERQIRGADRPAAQIARARGPERIMVVEDDDMVRSITAAILEEGGYQVVSEPGPSPALAHLLQTAEPIDLVVSDIMMPRMTGPAFGKVLATTHPGLPILFISGYTPDQDIRRDLTTLGHPFLAKPFTREALLQAVATGLARS